MSELLRESPAGQLIRYFTKDKFLKYAEEKEGFRCPSSYAQHDAPPTAFRATSTAEAQPPVASIDEKLEGAPGPEVEAAPPSSGSSTPSTESDTNPMEGAGATATRTATHAPELLSRITSRAVLEKVTTRKDLEQAYTEATMRSAVKTVPTQPIVPEKTADGTILVDWYTTDDQDNPQNWSFRKKCVVATQI
jgi:MFS transporter, DHA1 family, multidrug resistance protein